MFSMIIICEVNVMFYTLFDLILLVENFLTFYNILIRIQINYPLCSVWIKNLMKVIYVYRMFNGFF